MSNLDHKIFMDALDLGENFRLFMERVHQLYAEADKEFHDSDNAEEMLRMQGATESLQRVIDLPQAIKEEQDAIEAMENEEHEEEHTD